MSDGEGAAQPDTMWEQWARVPEGTRQWLWANDGMLLPPAVWAELNAARMQVWAEPREDGFWKLTSDAWEFIRQQRPFPQE